MQIRVTPAGFGKLTSIVPGLINDALGGGFCLPRGSQGVVIADIVWCGNNDCAGGTQGCRVNMNLDSINMSVPDPQTFRVETQFDVSTTVPVNADLPWPLPDVGCDLGVSLQNARVVADLAFSIDPATGHLRINLAGIQTLDITNINFSGCGFASDLLNAVIGALADVLSSAIGSFLVNALTPVLDGFVQSFLPDPLGMEGLLDLGGMLGGVSPGVEGELELSVIAGGYVSLPAGGLSLGMITAANADLDPATRAAARDAINSEPSLCVPSRPAPDFSMAPAGPLPTTTRQTFALMPANAFLGMPEPTNDIALGVSETFLDLTGHHVVSSGGLCLGVGTSTIDQLNLGTIGILVPSLTELGNGTGKEPLLLVVRPQRPLDFSIGDGTMASPSLTIHIKDMDVDFYAFLLERYVRGFTITLNLDVGLNLEFTTDAMGQPAIMPVLVGLDAASIGIDVSNAEFLREDPAQLEAVFPTLFNLILPLLGSGLAPIALPDLGGFGLTNLSVHKVTTSEDDFLAIYADLAPGMGKMGAIRDAAKWSPAAAALAPPTPFTAVDTTARVVRVTTPKPEAIRAYLEGRAGGALPEIELDLGGVGPRGTRYEWQWSLDGGLWRPYRAEARPVLSDKAFAVQGRHTLLVRARAVGDFRTWDQTAVSLPVVIDSVAPRLLLDRVAVGVPEGSEGASSSPGSAGRGRPWKVDGEGVVFPASDLVTDDAGLEWQFANVDEGAVERTGWRRDGGRLSLAEVERLGGKTGVLEVNVRDELGNTATEQVDVSGLLVGFHGRVPAGSGGCGCHVAGEAHEHGEDGGLAGALLGVLFVLALGLGRRALGLLGRLPLRRALPWVGLVLVAGFAPGCDCSGDTVDPPECLTAADCTSCTGATVPICTTDGMCQCADELPRGNVGPYSDLGVATDGRAWVSAYNLTYGDLMVALAPGPGRVPDDAWQFVDGVPQGPVVLAGAKVRGGIRDAGDDVGLYTSLAVSAQGEPMVSYYDKTSGSLRFAAQYGGTWTTTVIDQGTPLVPEIGGAQIGRYTSLTVGPDGRPGIAYMAAIQDGANQKTQARYARARSAMPTTSADWETWIIEEAQVPAASVAMPPVDLPDGIGLFMASARKADGAPVVAYYDRINGDLKVATFDGATNAFSLPTVVDGMGGADVGQYPSISVASDDSVHLAYVDAGRDNLLYVVLATGMPGTPGVPEVIDDGYRIDGTTPDGLPRPVYHLVGDDSQVVTPGGGVVAVVYQDATTHELLLAQRDSMGAWQRQVVAGAESPFAGAYGFYAAAEYGGQDVVMSSYVIDQPNTDYWVEVFRSAVVIP